MLNPFPHSSLHLAIFYNDIKDIQILLHNIYRNIDVFYIFNKYKSSITFCISLYTLSTVIYHVSDCVLFYFILFFFCFKSELFIRKEKKKKHLTSCD
jgi:hypothetical protein